MAGLDPRRSSRARATQSQSQVSSSSSSASGRPERSSRHFNKAGSPQKSASAGSLSSEPPEDTITADDTFATRRRTRGQVDDRDRAGVKAEAADMTSADDDVQEEDEAVRCVCGNEEYPGPPPLEDEPRHGAKGAVDVDPIFLASVTDDVAGFFVQCDVCKVWQHGGCVGIMTNPGPDEYFCELCRRDLHKLWTASNGCAQQLSADPRSCFTSLHHPRALGGHRPSINQVADIVARRRNTYSFYLPLRRQSRTSSRSASLNKEGTRSPTKEKETRSGRATSANQASKRRSTMNSREAAYDEAEALRRAIEASKEEAHLEPEGVPRRPKRGRSDSEEKQEGAKRQRTSSRSVSPSVDKTADDSDDPKGPSRNGNKSKPRGGARNNRNEKLSEKEEKERQRQEAANKRKGRAERRRADDSDPSEELPLAARAVVSKAVAPVTGDTSTSETVAETVQQPSAPEQQQPPPASQPTPDSPPTPAISQAKTDKKKSHKRKGRNQYTRDDEASPARSVSRDIQKDEHPPTGKGHHHGDGVGKAAHSRSRGGMSSKVTMNDMKRRAAALLEFISRTQVELAGETAEDAARNDVAKAAIVNPTSAPAVTNGTNGITTDDSTQNTSTTGPTSALESQEREFKELGCVEMMDSLTRRLVKWQQEYAV
ncbi:Histone deacetylase complex subunit [Podospora pseudoanserina]|uniref:Histone deacetylase complex subunit n=1 Tax=Podospora pseudoanserina TaxID=2609844 RepID=A0ABR0IRU9_9PEZI|nr:Histone deacetylase complex subunit [Podospora pseudoanserina]